jgi:hypothetical protein
VHKVLTGPMELSVLPLVSSRTCDLEQAGASSPVLEANFWWSFWVWEAPFDLLAQGLYPATFWLFCTRSST